MADAVEGAILEVKLACPCYQHDTDCPRYPAIDRLVALVRLEQAEKMLDLVGGTVHGDTARAYERCKAEASILRAETARLDPQKGGLADRKSVV